MSEKGSESDALYRYSFGDVEFNETSMTLSVAGQPVSLERRPLELLSTLLANADEVLTKEELLDTVWAGQTTVENVLANAVAKLRGALGTPGAERIVTHPRIGYRLAGPVERVAAGRKLVSDFDLVPGAMVSGREHFALETQMSSANGRETWTARHTKTGELRVYKFAADGRALSTIKREVTVFRLLKQSIPDSDCYASILDWNFAEPPFFIECEYSGTDLKAWAHKGDQIANMSLAERVELSIAVAEAVAKIHNTGVLHKDLKPANILVRTNGDNAPGIVLVDFGSGGLLSADELGAAGITPMGLTLDGDTGSLSGTPTYLAPELVGGQAPSIRSDVYALGIIIYQILSGDIITPLTANWAENIPDALLRDDIAAATRNDPAERLASAEAVAERLRSLTVRRERAATARAEAERLATAERLLVRSRARRPWAIAAAIALIGGLGASLWFANGTNLARAEAEQRANQAQTSRDFLSRVILYAGSTSGDGQADGSVETALDIAEEQMAVEQVDEPETLAYIAYEVGKSRDTLGQSQKAADAYALARARFEEVEGSAGPRTLDVTYRLAWVKVTLGELDEAETLLDEADELAATQKPLPFDTRYWALDSRANLLAARTDPATTDAFAALVDLYEQSSDPKRRDLELPADLENWERARLNLAQYHSIFSEHDLAREAFEPVRLRLEADGDTASQHRGARVLTIGSFLAFTREDFDNAIEMAEEARQMNVDQFGEDSSYVAQLDNMIGEAYLRTGNYAAAAKHLGNAHAVSCSGDGSASAYCMAAKFNYAGAAYKSGDLDLAHAEFERTRAGYLDIYGEGSPNVMRANYNLALIALDLGEFHEAEQFIATLDGPTMEQGDPLTKWSLYVDAVRARHHFRAVDAERGREQLETAIAAMREAGGTDRQVAPFVKELSIPASTEPSDTNPTNESAKKGSQ